MKPTSMRDKIQQFQDLAVARAEMGCPGIIERVEKKRNKMIEDALDS